MYSVAMLNTLLQRMRVSPKGVTSVRCVPGGATSSAVRLVALWVKAHRLALVYSHLMALLLPLSVLFVDTCWPTGLFCVIL